MKKERAILQFLINICADDLCYYLVIIFMDGKRVVSTHFIPLPEWHKFYDEKYEYYPMCYN